MQDIRIKHETFFFYIQILNGGNVTKSLLHFIPRPVDHGKTLTCRAENTELTHAAIEDHWKLTVHCKQKRSLFLTGLDSFTAYDIRRKGDKTADFTRKHKKVGHLGFLFHPPTKTFFSEAARPLFRHKKSNTNCKFFSISRCPFRETVLWV